MEKRMPLKKKSQKDGSKNGKPRLDREFMERKGKDFSQNIQEKKDRWKIGEKLSQRKVQEVQHQNNGSPTKRMMMEKKCATDEMSPLKLPSARGYMF